MTARGLVRLRADALNGSAALRWGLDWLLANAAGARLPLVQFHDGDHPGPHLTEALAPEQARTALRCLLALHARGLQAPLLFAPSTGWDIWNAEPGKRRAAGWKRWHGDGNGGWAEGEGEAIRLALRGRDPFARDDDYAELERTSLDVYDLLRHGRMRHDGGAA